MSMFRNGVAEQMDVVRKVKNNVRWFGHVERMMSKRWTKRIYENEVEEKKRRNAQRMT